jgi:hypothetical protein
MASKMKYTKGERLNIRFNGKIKLEFYGARLTSDGGLLAYRELDEALGLFKSVSTVMSDKRTGRNIQHDMTNLLRQSVYSRLAEYEDVNDSERLSVDPVMRASTGKKKNAASINTIGRFETEILTLRDNLEGLSEINGSWVEKAMERSSHHRIILDLDSSESPVLGEQVELLYYAKQKAKTGLQSSGIQTVLCCKVDMGNIYFCSDVDISCSRMDTQC